MNTSFRVLLATSDPAYRAAIATALEAHGLETLVCSRGEAALTTALEFRPDIIILDITMPHVSGFDLLEILRKSSQLAGAYIVLVSDLADPHEHSRAHELGADGLYIKSPGTIGNLLSQLQTHLRRSHPQ